MDLNDVDTLRGSLEGAEVTFASVDCDVDSEVLLAEEEMKGRRSLMLPLLRR